ncbi:hypothetical protein D9615_003256 [Tricholomella constricta]|uniref:MYND-type domain-containing protein n=1 Tax=Tricholomella constricta TaxID=117010 RepID=A0A8H5HJ61_9AGAR|nr:hypothetical protein D9615_003256 [Tricholomella constricta]
MATSMHAASHALTIALAVAQFRRGEPVDNTVTPICLACNNFQKPGKKLLQCSACKVALYCDQKCAAMDWKGTRALSGQKHDSHKEVCKEIKAANVRTPEMRAIAKQFPWARQERDGTFGFTIFQAAQGLLGSGREFGWWTRIPCCADASRYVWGFLLLEDEHLREDKGWKLPEEHVPWLDFAFGLATPPKAPPPAEQSWEMYYAWRGLPLQSPAVLLLHWPLSIYRLLHLLGLTSKQSTERRHLTVHLLGIEREIDFLPIFGELALLLPNTDLDLVIFGPGVANLLEKATAYPSCLASRPFVYTYRAPKASGAGTIRIELSRAGAFYDGTNISALRREKPDALLALNAGLATYAEWRPVVLASRALGIPFAVTDYSEASLRSDIRLLFRQLPVLYRTMWPAIELSAAEQERVREMAKAEYPIEMNPFMYPGPRPQAVHAGPNSFNGFTFVVTPGGRVGC